MAIGVWAWTEKDTFNNLSRLTNVALDPAFILILVGTVTFIIGFTGCVGALRENTCLLATFALKSEYKSTHNPAVLQTGKVFLKSKRSTWIAPFVTTKLQNQLSSFPQIYCCFLKQLKLKETDNR
ncbi:hypothetical protein K0M31_005726 [Melipona bicolor]|uniref:Uncharacterized protein n=1 Tax=Melipona bicolor TaxID=60889 RepID=A0AA40KMA2_9HYME|nr:hypothetical protein K0M31_005726 [Melipona bicolor]